jgi:cell division protein FtsN
VSNARQRLSARDYKHGGRRGGGFDPAKYQQFWLGLGIGLAVALLVWLQGQRNPPAPPSEPVAEAAPAAPEVPAEDEVAPEDELDFYGMLPAFEVVVPAADRSPRREQAFAALTKPGAYLVQAGSYRDRAVAERQLERITKLGIDAVIQQDIIDGLEWNRVRIGPTRDLAAINAAREALHAAQIEYRTYELGE